MQDVNVTISTSGVKSFISFERLIYLADKCDLNPNFNSKKEKVADIIIKNVPDGLEDDCKKFVFQLATIHLYKDDVNKFIKNNK